MKMSEKTLLKKIEQAFKENCCNGSYKLELDVEYNDYTYYVLFYTYETGETIAVDIDVSWLGEVKFYSPVHCYYISNFNNYTKSVINVLRMLFDMIDSNKDAMVNYYKIKTEETEETTEKEDCKTVKEKEQYFDTDALQPNKKIIAKIENINHCPNQNTCCIVSPFVHCNYNYKSDSCIKAHKKFIHDCEQVHKQMKAISNPEWHHVNLETLRNIDFDMIDKKRKVYLSVYRELQQTLSYLRKCKTQDTYDTCFIRYLKRKNVMYADGKFSIAMFNFIYLKLSMQNVESGVWASDCEDATGYHKSRRYNKSRVGK